MEEKSVGQQDIAKFFTTVWLSCQLGPSLPLGSFYSISFAIRRLCTGNQVNITQTIFLSLFRRVFHQVKINCLLSLDSQF